MSSTSSKSQEAWQIALAQAVTDPRELIQLLNLDPSFIPAAEKAAELFPLRVPRGFIARMQKNNIHDPLLKQVLPLEAELNKVYGFTRDPLDEKKANPIPGLLHKYHGRVLLTVTGVCGVNCRYCFRRSFPYEDNNPGLSGWDKAMDYIIKDSSINEVILSGGDPLIASDSYLEKLISKISAISHVKWLRIHTRMPVVLSERVTEKLMDCLVSTRLKTVVVIHANHPQELDENVLLGLKKLSSAGVMLLNQSVLLRSINDDAATLVALSHRLFDYGVLPYYLHLLDRVQGVAHFDVEESSAKALLKQIHALLPGYLVPKLVRELPGEAGKSLLEYT